MSRKRIITIVSIILGCALVLLVVFGVLVYKSIISPLLAWNEIPPELQKPRVITGADLLVKSEFYQVGKGSSWGDLVDPEKLANRLDSVKDMRVGQLDGQGDLDIGLAGQRGLTLLDRQGNLTKRINYRFEKEKSKSGVETQREKDSFYKMRLLDVEGDGVCEVLGFNGLDGMALFDHQGNVLFSRGEHEEGKPSIHEVAVGDVDGDGVTEFIASWGYEPWNGLELLDRNGNSRWRHEEELVPGEMEVVDVDGDGKPELVEVNAGDLKIRDTQGGVKSTVTAPVYLTQVSLCPQPNTQGPPRNLAVTKDGLWLIDLDGKNHTRYDAPLSQIKLEKPRVLGVPGSSDAMTIDTEDVYRAKGVGWSWKRDGLNTWQWSQTSQPSIGRSFTCTTLTVSSSTRRFCLKNAMRLLCCRRRIAAGGTRFWSAARRLSGVMRCVENDAFIHRGFGPRLLDRVSTGSGSDLVKP